MTETTALAIPVESEWAIMREQAAYLVRSGFMPKAIKTPEQALAIMLMGRELGIGPTAAINSINVIDGKPSVSAQLALALFIRSGKCEEIDVKGDASACMVTLKRKSQPAHSETFTMQDAERLGLSTKDNWRRQPAVMLKWRAVMACLRIVAPDILSGLYSPDEMGQEEHAASHAWRITDEETGEILFEDGQTSSAPVTEGEFKEVDEVDPFANLDAALSKI